MSKQTFAVIVFAEKLTSDLSLSLQSLEADGVSRESICIVGKGLKPGKGLEGCRVGALDFEKKQAFDFINDFLSSTQYHAIAFLNAGDIWLRGKRLMIDDAFSDASLLFFAHQYYYGRYGGFKRKLWVSRKSHLDQSCCPLSALVVRNEALAQVLAIDSVLSKSFDLSLAENTQVSSEVFSIVSQGAASRIGNRFRRQLKQEIPSANALTDFRDRHKGKRCFVIGNGPSLNQMNLNALGDDITFVSNSFHLLFDQISWRPNYYACIDSAVLPDSADNFSCLIPELPETSFFFPDWLGDDDIDRIKWDSSSFLPASSNVCYFDEKSPPSNAQPCSSSLSSYLNRVPTVTGALLQLAVLMGCSPVYLIGCDTVYSVPKDAQLIKPLRPGGTERIMLSNDSDPNHFAASYFGEGKIWHQPQADVMLDFYERFRAQVDPNGERIFNSTIGGALEAFPRVDYTTLF